jgi:hypothetical protein
MVTLSGSAVKPIRFRAKSKLTASG